MYLHQLSIHVCTSVGYKASDFTKLVQTAVIDYKHLHRVGPTR